MGNHPRREVYASAPARVEPSRRPDRAGRPASREAAASRMVACHPSPRRELDPAHTARCWRCRRRTCTCTSPGRCGIPRSSISPTGSASVSPAGCGRSGRRCSRRPTSAAGSGSSGSTTSPGPCCAGRRTCADCSTRRSPTRRPRGPGGSRSRSTRPVTRRRSVGSTPFTELVLDAVAASVRTHGVGVGVIIAANRTRNELDARTLARLAARFADRGVVGFGLSNDERRAPAEAFAHAFGIAARAGLLLTPHAGELLGPESVRASLDALHADRLGHGVRWPRTRHSSTGSPRPGSGSRCARRRTSVWASTPTCRPGPAAPARRCRRSGGAWRRRPAAVRAPADRPVRGRPRDPRVRRRGSRRPGAVELRGLAGALGHRRDRAGRHRRLGPIRSRRTPRPAPDTLRHAHVDRR